MNNVIENHLKINISCSKKKNVLRTLWFYCCGTLWRDLFSQVTGSTLLWYQKPIEGPYRPDLGLGLTHWPLGPLEEIFYNQFLAATKQLNEWYFPSVRLSVCPSVTPFWLCSHHQIIMKFSGVITNDKSDVHAKGQGQRSKVKVTEVMTPFSRFRTVTPVWIHILRWNYAYSLVLLRRGALLFFKVICQISRSHG